MKKLLLLTVLGIGSIETGQFTQSYYVSILKDTAGTLWMKDFGKTGAPSPITSELPAQTKKISVVFKDTFNQTEEQYWNIIFQDNQPTPQAGYFKFEAFIKNPSQYENSEQLTRLNDREKEKTNLKIIVDKLAIVKDLTLPKNLEEIIQRINLKAIEKDKQEKEQLKKEEQEKQNNIFICKPTSPSDDPFVLVQYKTGTEPAPTIFVNSDELGNADKTKWLIKTIDNKNLYLIDCNTIAADKFKGEWEDRNKPRLDKILLEQRIIEGTGTTTTSMTYKIDETSRNFLKTNIIMIIKEFQLEQFQQEQLKKQREQEEKLAKELLEQNRLLKESEKKRQEKEKRELQEKQQKNKELLERLIKEKLAAEETEKTNQLVYDLALAFRKLG